MHLKRHSVPKSWPVHRKGTKYVVRPFLNPEQGVPILILLRDILKVVTNRREAKKVIYEKKILLNNKPVKNEKNSALLFDVITIVPDNKHYKVDLTNNGKIKMTEINEKESLVKVAKVVNKNILKGKKTQLNLSDGKNFISDLKCSTNDSVIINLKHRKIEKCIPLKTGSEIIVIDGKHAGKRGIAKKIDNEKRIIELDTGKEIINVLIKKIIVIK